MRPIYLRDLGIILVMGAILGLLGPFGTYKDMPWQARFPYWIAAALVGWAQLLPVLAALRASPRFRPQGSIAEMAVASLVAAFPMTFIVAWVESSLRAGKPFPLELLPMLYVKVFTISVSIGIVWQALRRPSPEPAGSVTAEAERPVEETPAPRDIAVAEPPRPVGAAAERAFMKRLPRPLGDRLLALEAEDHYLRVHASAGSDLLLLRLADAVEELDGLPGLQVHRSWWVARDAVRRLHREGGRLTLELSNGLRVPVSRTYGLAVRQAGWDMPGGEDRPSAAN
ncbi:MAG TPA: LytTR family DNA-binding domain-containing protein [Azospirillaceae bacterium]|nr:LytTR family DNA-binding domain-containing protein [Azospirillaceae bacterium]